LATLGLEELSGDAEQPGPSQHRGRQVRAPAPGDRMYLADEVLDIRGGTPS
jgi:hypothetical protein